MWHYLVSVVLSAYRVKDQLATNRRRCSCANLSSSVEL